MHAGITLLPPFGWRVLFDADDLFAVGGFRDLCGAF